MARRGWVITAGGALGAGVVARWCRGQAGWQWVADGSLNEGRSGHVAVALGDGGVLVAGGHAPGDLVRSSAELREPSGTWASAGTMTTPRAGAAAVRLADGRVLVAGGWTGTVITDSAEIWDPPTNTWTSTGSLAHPRAGHAAVLLADDRALVAGGGSSTGGFPAHTELFDPATGMWSPVGAMSLGRQQLALTRLPDGTVLAAGGDAEGDLGVTTCERYDPSTATWSPTGALSISRSHDEAGGFAATLLGDGRVLVAGGFHLNGAASYLNSSEAYQPANGAWSSLPPLAGPGRVQPAAVSLGDGSGLVIGGWTGDVALGDAFRFDPSSDTWSTLPPLAVPRGGHTATALPDGDVVVVGGYSPNLGGLAGMNERLTSRGGCCGLPRRGR